jgi:site-specific recombinase XerD
MPYSVGLGLAPKCPFRSTHTCCATAAATPLANTGHDTRALQAWLGHKNIQHTVRYTELAPDRFRNFWR